MALQALTSIRSHLEGAVLFLDDASAATIGDVNFEQLIQQLKVVNVVRLESNSQLASSSDDSPARIHSLRNLLGTIDSRADGADSELQSAMRKAVFLVSQPLNLCSSNICAAVKQHRLTTVCVASPLILPLPASTLVKFADEQQQERVQFVRMLKRCA